MLQLVCLLCQRLNRGTNITEHVHNNIFVWFACHFESLQVIFFSPLFLQRLRLMQNILQHVQEAVPANATLSAMLKSFVLNIVFFFWFESHNYYWKPLLEMGTGKTHLFLFFCRESSLNYKTSSYLPCCHDSDLYKTLCCITRVKASCACLLAALFLWFTFWLEFV